MEEIIEEIPLTPLKPAKIYVHHYDKNTHEFLYKEEAEIDKQATKRLGYNVHLLPAYSTLKLLPEYKENEIPVYSSHTEQQTTTEQIPVYDEETGEIISYQEQEKITDVLIEEWTVKPDYRKNFYKVDDNLNVLPIDTIGEQEGFYLVDKSTGDLIKENPDKYKISDGNVVAKTDEEYLQEQAEKNKNYLIEEVNYPLKAKVAYTGVRFDYEGQELVFETNETSISMINFTAMMAQQSGLSNISNWKCRKTIEPFEPVSITFTAEQFQKLIAFASQMVLQAFAVEEQINQKIQALSVEQLNNPLVLEQTKQQMELAYNNVPVKLENLFANS